MLRPPPPSGAGRSRVLGRNTSEKRGITRATHRSLLLRENLYHLCAGEFREGWGPRWGEVQFERGTSNYTVNNYNNSNQKSEKNNGPRRNVRGFG